jgi:hypothetical protein
MSRAFLLLVLSALASVAAADDSTPNASTMYIIGLSVRDVTATAKGAEEIKVVAGPKVATVENRDAVFHVGQQTKVADQTVRAGTSLKIRLKKLGDGKVRVTGVLELASFSHPSDDFVERHSTEYHFARTISLGEKICLGKRQTTEGYRIVEITCHQVDTSEPVATSPRSTGAAQRRPARK